MNLLFLTFVVCCLFCQTQGYEILAEKSNASEQDCLELLLSNEFDPTALNAKYIGFAMKRGFWKCAKELSNIANSVRIDVRSVFDMESRTIAKEIKEIKSTIESTLPVSIIAPAFQWAQSPTEIFISVKFAHKLDAPATLNVEAETVNITDDKLILKATDGRKIFNLNVDFLRKVNPAESSWSMASVGRMTITLKKQTGPDNWVRLTKSKKKPNNIHFWWELHEKHAKELEALEDDEEDGNDPVVKPPPTAADDIIEKEGSQSKDVTTDEQDSTSTTSSDAAGAGAESTSESSTDEKKEEGDGSDAAAATAKPKKEKKKKIKKEKKDKKPKKPTLDDLVKELEKAGKELKKDIDRKAKAEKEAINLDTEEKIKNLKRDFYKKSKDDEDTSKESDANTPPPIPTDLDKLLPDDAKPESTGDAGSTLTEAIKEEL